MIGGESRKEGEAVDMRLYRPQVGLDGTQGFT